MARGRMISKAISLDEKVNALSGDTVRLLFTWLIPHLDCEGRTYGDPQTVKSIVFPRRNISVAKIEKYLKELEKLELILRYSVNGNQYLCMKNFEKHQVGLRKNKEIPSQIPPLRTDSGRNEDGNSPTQVKVKVKDKVYTYKGGKLTEEQKQLFDILLKCPAINNNESAKLIELCADYPSVNYELEFKKFVEWWPGPKGRKKPWSTLRNWLEKVQERQSGKAKGHFRKIPDTYSKPPTYDD